VGNKERQNQKEIGSFDRGNQRILSLSGENGKPSCEEVRGASKRRGGGQGGREAL